MKAGVLMGAGIATALGLALLGRRANAAPHTATARGDAVSDLARVLIVELSGGGTDAERAGIVHVALNRSKRYGAPVADVIRSRVPGRSEWGSGCGRTPTCAYNQKLDAAHLRSAFPAMAEFARKVVAGAVPNPIAGRLTFCHPAHRTFDQSRARGTPEQRAEALALRQEAAMASTQVEARNLYRRANAVEQVDSRYAWHPHTGRYLPIWTIARDHGGEAATTPITIGSTRFA